MKVAWTTEFVDRAQEGGQESQRSTFRSNHPLLAGYFFRTAQNMSEPWVVQVLVAGSLIT